MGWSKVVSDQINDDKVWQEISCTTLRQIAVFFILPKSLTAHLFIFEICKGQSRQILQ